MCWAKTALALFTIVLPLCELHGEEARVDIWIDCLHRQDSMASDAELSCG